MKNAFRIFFHAGWKREVLLVVTVLLNGAVQGIGTSLNARFDTVSTQLK